MRTVKQTHRIQMIRGAPNKPHTFFVFSLKVHDQENIKHIKAFENAFSSLERQFMLDKTFETQTEVRNSSRKIK